MSRTAAKPWPIDWNRCTAASVTNHDILASALASAQAWLYTASGRRYGEFTTVEDGYRPACSDACTGPSKGSDGIWRNRIGDAHDCCRIELARQPVRSITSVAVHGVVLDADDYAIDANRLMRVGSCWPCCDDCEPACVVVDYTWGVPPDVMALRAVEELACELLAGMTGQACKLPSRAVSVSRQGVTIDMDDASTFVQLGLTGLPITDSWIKMVNPARLAGRSRVYSPDVARQS